MKNLRLAARGFRKRVIVPGAVMAVTFAFAGGASALEITTVCPLSPLAPGETRQYSITIDDAHGAASCYAYGSGSLSGAGNDAFLNLAAGFGWTFEGKNDAFAVPGSTFVGQNGTWLIDDFDPDLQYAVGVKDGGNPKWAVFLIPYGALAGIESGLWGVTTTSGALSHLALYSRTPLDPSQDPQDPIVPEPTTLALFGLGLVVGAARLRRGRHART